MFAQSSWLGPRNVQAGNAGAKLQYIVGLRMEGAEGGVQVREIRGHTVTYYDSCLRRDDDKCTVRCDKLEHGEHDACWRGCDNGAVSHRVVPCCETHLLCSCPKGCPRFAPTASKQASEQG